MTEIFATGKAAQVLLLVSAWLLSQSAVEPTYQLDALRSTPDRYETWEAEARGAAAAAWSAELAQATADFVLTNWRSWSLADPRRGPATRILLAALRSELLDEPRATAIWRELLDIQIVAGPRQACESATALVQGWSALPAGSSIGLDVSVQSGGTTISATKASCTVSGPGEFASKTIAYPVALDRHQLTISVVASVRWLDREAQWTKGLRASRTFSVTVDSGRDPRASAAPCDCAHGEWFNANARVVESAFVIVVELESRTPTLCGCAHQIAIVSSDRRRQVVPEALIAPVGSLIDRQLTIAADRARDPLPAQVDLVLVPLPETASCYPVDLGCLGAAVTLQSVPVVKRGALGCGTSALP